MTGDLTGKVVKSYELEELIGEGGFGAVYRARQKFINREVAIKIILPHYANRPEFIRRFETEAQLIARLEHPHIVPLYDYWREPTGAYLVMRLLRGGSIQDSINKDGPWTPLATSTMLNQITEALAVAHRQGVIHRDLKPENILLDEDGNAYLSDFGIAKELRGNTPTITETNAIIGSPAYLSPEQIRGEQITPQTDVYALGIVLYEMLTGERPYDDDTPATLLYKHLSSPLPKASTIISSLPEELNNVLIRATAKEPDMRHESVIELARDFHRAIKGGESSSETAVLIATDDIAIPDPENPYKGLRAFQQADAADFFGRAKLIEKIIDRFKDDDDYGRFLAIVGPSGSGKSSVVKAGIIPAIRRGALPDSEQWFVVEMVPGIDPMEELEAALLRIAVNPPESLLSQLNEDDRGLLRAIKRVLPDTDSEIVLVIDQFEELFTLVDDEAQRAHFLNSILTAATNARSQLRIIITLRADFYDRPLNYTRFGELIRRRTEVILPMTPEELELAIAGPARRVGMGLEQGLVTAIVADVGEQPGTLPLLQYALTELFERRQGIVLTQKAYQEIGGTMGALAKRADELYDSLSDEGQEIARQIFLRLITLGDGTEDTRRRVLQSELLTIKDDFDLISMIIDAFGRYRLLTFDHDPISRTATVEVAHEALIRQWIRLRDWLANSREDLRTQRRLTAAAEEWILANRDRSFLARGSRLQRFETWREATNLAVNQTEKEYLQASIEEREKLLAQEAERQAREAALEQRSRNVLRALVGVMAFALVVALALTALAISQRQDAQEARSIAEASALAAQASAAEARSLALAANARNALIENERTLGLALAVEASTLYEPAPVEVRRVLSAATYGSGSIHRLTEHDSAVMSTALSTSGDVMISGGADGMVFVWDNQTGDLIRQIDLGEVVVTAVDISSDESFILAATTDHSIYLIDLTSGEEIRTLEGHTDTVTDVIFMTGDTRALSGSLDTDLRLWDVETGESLQVYDGHHGVILSIAASSDGQYVASSSGDDTISEVPDAEVDRTVRVWDIESGEEIQRFELGGGFVRTVTFHPSGNSVASASWSSGSGGQVFIWDIVTGEEQQRLRTHEDIITRIRFDATGSTLYTASWDQTLRLWDVNRGVEIARFEDFEDRILDFAITVNQEYLAVATGNLGNNEIERQYERSNDTSVWLIDLINRDQIRLYSGHEDWVMSLDVSPDGRYAASGAGALRDPWLDTSVRIWDVETGEEIRRLDGHTRTVEGIQFSPNGDTLLTASWDGNVILWDVETGEMIRRFGDGETSHEERAIKVAFSADGETALSTGSMGEIILWDVEAGQMLREFIGHDALVSWVKFAPDGTRIASSSWDNTIAIWDVETGEMLQRMEGHRDRVTGLDFSPDGLKLLSSSWDLTVRLWNAETGEELRQFIGHNERIQTVIFHQDGQVALSGGGDMTLRLWDVETAQELGRYDGHTNWVSGIVFLPDSSLALSSGQDNTLRLWNIPQTIDEIVNWAAENRYIMEFTCAQREQYRIEPLCD